MFKHQKIFWMNLHNLNIIISRKLDVWKCSGTRCDFELKTNAEGCRLWSFIILLEMMLEVVIGVMVMEVDKVANEVTNMEVDKVTDMKIPIDDLTDVILAIGDTYRDDVRSV